MGREGIGGAAIHMYMMVFWSQQAMLTSHGLIMSVLSCLFKARTKP